LSNGRPKSKGRFLYSANHMIGQEQRALQFLKWKLIGKSQWCCRAMRPLIARTNEQLDHRLQPANTSQLQSTTPGLHPASIHQMAPHRTRQQTSDYSLLLTYRRIKDERLSWPSWLTCSGWFTHISGHPSAAAEPQDSESSPDKNRRSATVIGGPRI